MSKAIYWDDEIRDLGRPFWEWLLTVAEDDNEAKRVAYIKQVLKNFDTYDAMQAFKNAVGKVYPVANNEGE